MVVGRPLDAQSVNRRLQDRGVALRPLRDIPDSRHTAPFQDDSSPRSAASGFDRHKPRTTDELDYSIVNARYISSPSRSKWRTTGSPGFKASTIARSSSRLETDVRFTA